MVNGEGNVRGGTTTDEKAAVLHASSTTGSDRDRRAARRRKAREQDSAWQEAAGETREQKEEIPSGDSEGESGDCHMTPAVKGCHSENYYTALDGYEEAGGAEALSEGPSEAPSIRSPFKPTRRR